MEKLIVEIIANLDINTGLILLLMFKIHSRVKTLEIKEEMKEKAAS